MITSNDFKIMGINDSKENVDYAVKLVNMFYNQKNPPLNMWEFYSSLDKYNKYPKNIISLARKFHEKFADEMFSG